MGPRESAVRDHRGQVALDELADVLEAQVIGELLRAHGTDLGESQDRLLGLGGARALAERVEQTGHVGGERRVLPEAEVQLRSGLVEVCFSNEPPPIRVEPPPIRVEPPPIRVVEPPPIRVELPPIRVG